MYAVKDSNSLSLFIFIRRGPFDLQIPRVINNWQFPYIYTHTHVSILTFLPSPMRR